MDGGSFYTRAVASYVRTGEGNLIRSFGHDNVRLQEAWFKLKPIFATQEPSSWHVLSSVWEDGVQISVYELQRPQGVFGVVVRDLSADLKSDEVFARLLLNHLSQYGDELAKAVCCNGEPLADRLVEVFEQELLFQPPSSQWDTVGRAAMRETISFFTSRKLPVVMCLPAFPCKSSNLNKVGGVGPDRGEELALRWLHEVLGRMQDIYVPGAYLCIISDGHVFSDCIGVDDTQVDQYGAQLHNLNRAIGDSDSQRISFLSLPDLLEGGQTGHDLPLLALQHHIPTDLTGESELCRQMLLHMCGSNPNSLRNHILTQDASVLALYRGFARFMLEDLEEHAAARGLSRSQRKKLAEKLAFEMILRNQAYSNLTELFLPHFLRLSIHAHANSGPKFGICLFNRATTRLVSSVNELAGGGIGSFGDDASPHLLHIPTPWHNCVLRIAGHQGFFVAKAKVVRKALASGQVRGHWVPAGVAADCGAADTFGIVPSVTGTTIATTEPRRSVWWGWTYLRRLRRYIDFQRKAAGVS
ncbi:hypothetical protein BO82DRAFT_373412 [Aspergillus uvarum CBS 121591]|uniref:Pyoverdine/dityrosine biosynthesis protein n=1 Tax=Aspergillus uvarum CBS 121591 TaxID=1448315 RepID=A0A319CHW5_9EURO|nr:hypothetical protein BO82DRAFT_373412 [Aspergillus uvarum CBS 121591]PYH83391.1 hypothetical protein BO82DRAFT_373412 [Aspergillus uvarum CBS 121591]